MLSSTSEEDLSSNLLDSPKMKSSHSNSEPDGKKSSHTRLRIISFLITLSSFSWGYTVSVLNVCIVSDAKGSVLVDFNLSNAEQELATALVLIGAWFGAVISNKPVEKFGRKPVLLISNLLYIIGGIVCAFATTKHAIFVGRSITGLACGAVTVVVPTLLTEISPDTVRGQITTLHQLQLTVGILASGLLGYIVISEVPSGWRYLTCFAILPPILQSIFCGYLPESPRWLITKNRSRNAKEVLLQIRYPQEDKHVEDEVEAMLADTSNHHAKTNTATWRDLLIFKKQVAIGIILMFFQAMTGINTVILYSAKIFSFAGVHHPIAATASVGTVNVLVTFLSVALVDKIGRRILLLIGTSVMVFSLGVLSIVLLDLNAKVQLQGFIAIVCVLIYVAGFAIGLGAVVWVVLGEIIPTNIRPLAMGLFMCVSYLCNIFIASSTLSIIKLLGRGKNSEKNGIAKLYGICCVISIAAIVFILMFLPETKGRSLDGKQKVHGKIEEDKAELLDPTNEVNSNTMTEL